MESFSCSWMLFASVFILAVCEASAYEYLEGGKVFVDFDDWGAEDGRRVARSAEDLNLAFYQQQQDEQEEFLRHLVKRQYPAFGNSNAAANAKTGTYGNYGGGNGASYAGASSSARVNGAGHFLPTSHQQAVGDSHAGAPTQLRSGEYFRRAAASASAAALANNNARGSFVPAGPASEQGGSSSAALANAIANTNARGSSSAQSSAAAIANASRRSFSYTPEANSRRSAAAAAAASAVGAGGNSAALSSALATSADRRMLMHAVPSNG